MNHALALPFHDKEMKHVENEHQQKLNKSSLIGLVIGSMIGGGAFNIISDMGSQAGGLALIIGWGLPLSA